MDQTLIWATRVEAAPIDYEECFKTSFKISLNPSKSDLKFNDTDFLQPQATWKLKTLLFILEISNFLKKYKFGIENISIVLGYFSKFFTNNLFRNWKNH